MALLIDGLLRQIYISRISKLKIIRTKYVLTIAQHLLTATVFFDIDIEMVCILHDIYLENGIINTLAYGKAK